jgi:hypothetical protein
MSDKLLENAVASIKLGVVDYKMINNDETRVLSSVRNLYAGIMLLIKYVLCQKMEALIYKNIKPVQGKDGSIYFVKNGKQTVDYLLAKERCDSLGILMNWKSLESLQRIRNDIEHNFYDGGKNQINEAIAKSFLIINEFFDANFDKKAVDFFGENIWNIMLKEKMLYDDIKSRCDASKLRINDINENIENILDSAECDNCGSELVCVKSYLTSSELVNLNLSEISELYCEACGHLSNAVGFFEKYIRSVFPYSWRDEAHGEQDEISTCQNCFNYSFYMSDMVCLICGHEDSYRECIMCGDNIDLDLDGKFCGGCEHTMSKEMDDD